jgi:hypothetical protein
MVAVAHLDRRVPRSGIKTGNAAPKQHNPIFCPVIDGPLQSYHPNNIDGWEIVGLTHRWENGYMVGELLANATVRHCANSYILPTTNYPT